jgi:hypothetical protein
MNSHSDQLISEHSAGQIPTPDYHVSASCAGWGTFSLSHDDPEMLLRLFKQWLPVAGTIKVTIYKTEWRHMSDQPVRYENPYPDLAYSFVYCILYDLEEPR